jgi:Asp-tRNA(Asn)/Glu-tRNA(Gln) amidotransferase A subunit family amidase
MSIAAAAEVWRMSATQLAEAIRSRQVSSQDVIEAHRRRIDAVNGSINAVVIVMVEEALKGANTADRAVADGADLGPFHGVPFTVKEKSTSPARRPRKGSKQWPTHIPVEMLPSLSA